MNQKKWARGLWVAVILVLAFGMYYRWSVLNAYDTYLTANNLGPSPVWEEIYGRNAIFLILGALLALVRQWLLDGLSWSRTRQQFFRVELGLWFLAGVYWLCRCLGQLGYYIRPDQQWLGSGGQDTVLFFGPILLGFYTLRWVYDCCPEWKAEWTSDRPLVGKLLYTPVILVFGGIRGQKTGAGKVLLLVGLGHFGYLLATTYGLDLSYGPDVLHQNLSWVAMGLVRELYPATMLALIWWVTEKR